MTKKLELTLVITEAKGHDGLANLLRNLANRIEAGEMTIKSTKHDDQWYYAEVFEMPAGVGDATTADGLRRHVDIAELVEHAEKYDHKAARIYAISMLEDASASDKRRLVVATNKDGELVSGFVPLGADDETIAIALGMNSHEGLLSYDILSSVRMT